MTPEGPRTVRNGERCPVFKSDSHKSDIMVVCPTCGSTSVRRATPGEVA